MRLLIGLLFCISSSIHGQSITGKWKTIDDETGEHRSVVEIFEKNGRYFGRVMRIFPREGGEPDPVCKACPEDDERFNKKVIGMNIIRNMKAFGDYYAGGDILDPKVGKIYKCKLWIDGADLKVRGYWGPFYRTQTWKRVN